MRSFEINNLDNRRWNIKDVYSSRAKSYDFLLSMIGHKLAVDYFIDNLPFEKDQALKILDAGCGTGLYSFSILKKFPNSQVTAFDFNNQMLEICRQRLGKDNLENRVNLFTGDVTKPVLGLSDKFDLIITGGVLEYVNINQAVKNLSQYLLPEGLFLNVTVTDNFLGQIVGNIWKFTPKSQEENLKVFMNNNFSLLKVLGFPLTKEAHLFKKLEF